MSLLFMLFRISLTLKPVFLDTSYITFTLRLHILSIFMFYPVACFLSLISYSSSFFLHLSLSLPLLSSSLILSCNISSMLNFILSNSRINFYIDVRNSSSAYWRIIDGTLYRLRTFFEIYIFDNTNKEISVENYIAR